MPEPIPIIAYRGPFAGLWGGASKRVPPLHTRDCLNVETRQGDIRRRPGIEQAAAPTWSNAPIRILRMIPLFHYENYAASHATAPHVLLVALTDLTIDRLSFHLVDLSSGTLRENFSSMYPEVFGTRELYTFGVAVVARQMIVYRGLTLIPWVMYLNSGDTFSHIPLAQSALPGNVTGAPVAGGSLPYATYEYTIQMGNQETGIWGKPNLLGTAQVTTAGGNQTARLTMPGADSWIDRVQIWRKEVGVDAEFYRVTDVAFTGSGMTFDDDGTFIVTKDEGNRLDSTGFYDVGRGAELAVWRGRMWADEDAGENVFYSQYNEFWNFRLVNSLRAGDGFGDRMLRMIPLGGVLIVLRKKTIWAITGSGPESFEATRIAKIGCAGQNAVVEARGIIYFGGYDAPYRVSGQAVEPLGNESHTPFWAAFVDHQYITAAWDDERGLLLFSGYTAWDHTSGQTLAIHLRTGRWYKWAFYGGAAGPAIGVGNAVLDYTERPRTLIWVPGATNAANRLAMLRYESDGEQRDWATDSVPWHWDVGPTDFGVGGFKSILYGQLEWDHDSAAAGETLEVELYADGAGPQETKSVLDDIERATAKLSFGVTLHDVKFRIKGDTNRRPRIVGLEIGALAVPP